MILIFGQVADPHVTAVRSAIERLGKNSCLVDIFSEGNSGFAHEVSQQVQLILKGTNNSSAYSAIWWRTKPRLVVPGTSAGDLYDYYFVHREWRQIFDFLGRTTQTIFSINQRENADRADNKLLQLQAAVNAGFEIPETLVSNDADTIVSFIDSHAGERCVYKPFTPYMPPSGLITFTTAVESSAIESNREAIAVTPGIYQVFIRKAFELRITVVGEELFSAKIDSNRSVATQIDWRQGLFDDIYSHFEVEDNFRIKLLSLHRKLGLFFAAYDFIVDEEGRIVFLEVNPTGQWLWLEQRLGLPISERLAGALVRADSYSSY